MKPSASLTQRLLPLPLLLLLLLLLAMLVGGDQGV